MCIDTSFIFLIKSCPNAHKYLVKKVETSVHRLNKKKVVTIENRIMDMENSKKLRAYFDSLGT
jgi:hypothetical protein